MKKMLALLICCFMIVSFASVTLADYDTAKLQLYLKYYGYYMMKVDGLYGNGTRQALKDFQAENDLEVTGEANEQTIELLYNGKPVSKLPPFELRKGITWGMTSFCPRTIFRPLSAMNT